MRTGRSAWVQLDAVQCRWTLFNAVQYIRLLPLCSPNLGTKPPADDRRRRSAATQAGARVITERAASATQPRRGRCVGVTAFLSSQTAPSGQLSSSSLSCPRPSDDGCTGHMATCRNDDLAARDLGQSPAGDASNRRFRKRWHRSTGGTLLP